MEWPDNSLPKAGLKASQTLIGPGSTVKFSAACSQNTEEITWSLPGSSSESAEGDSVSVTYDKEGVYDVTVTAKNSSGEDTKTVEGLVFVTSELEKDGELLLLSQDKATEATAYVNENEAPPFAVDGDVTKKWCATGTPPHELIIDLGEEVAVSQVAIAHAEAGGEKSGYEHQSIYNLCKYRWNRIYIYCIGYKKYISRYFGYICTGKCEICETVSCETYTGSDTAARIYEVQIYGLEKTLAAD